MRVLGIDLSLTQTAACLVPSSWELDWSRLHTMIVGAKLKREATIQEQIGRINKIHDAIESFIYAQRPDVVALEEYAFVTHVRSGVHALGELGGVIKRRIVASGIPIVTYPAARARKMLGKAPRSDAKVWAAQKLYAAGAPKTWSLDECDAFLQANAYLAENGGHAIALEAA